MLEGVGSYKKHRARGSEERRIGWMRLHIHADGAEEGDDAETT